MDKSLLHKKIIAALEHLHQGAADAAKRAHESATDEENEAENKYDTLGLEAAYLAHGQSQRVAQCEADLLAFKKLPVIDFTDQLAASPGALITLVDEQGIEQNLFLGPVAGGLKLTFMARELMLITVMAPLGKALCGCRAGDEVEIRVAGQNKHYQIIDLC
ncbi:MAG TPA: transcription elongation factor [Gammaproteobacteria bacterium]|nr:transcription elongation factor [Gammaproteobacteria bacterium]